MDPDNVIYVVEPDQTLARALTALLGTYGIQVEYFSTLQNFLETARAQPNGGACLLLDANLPEMNGASVVRKLSNNQLSPAIIVVGDKLDKDTRKKLKEAGATDVVDRSLVAAYLFTSVSRVLPGAKLLPSTAPCCLAMGDDSLVTFRMMHPEDAEIEQTFVKSLSDRSRYLRFFSGLTELPGYVLKAFTHPDFPISYAVIATIPEGDGERQIGVARYAPTETAGAAEFAVVVADDWQGRGVASQLMHLIITAAAVGGVARLEGLILKENVAMLALAKKLGFTESSASGHGAGPSAVLMVKSLRDREATPQ